MQKIEMTITPDYVADWTIGNAVRELLQNAIDEQVNGHQMHVNYNPTIEELIITSDGAKLSISSLLLGSTTKANDDSSIGQFGEGYKIATLVLLRNGKEIVFSNGMAKETWKPRFIKSKRFGCDILGFFIEKWSPFVVSAGELAIHIRGITEKEYTEQIVPEALILSNDWHIIEHTPLGNIINKPGSVYVNGLFVCNHGPYKYGYDFLPGNLRLDRDRKLASDFDLEWLASKVWAATDDMDKIVELIESGAPDVRYVLCDADSRKADMLADKAWAAFIEKYGKNAVPVTTQEELAKISAANKPVIVTTNHYNILIRSSGYHEPELKTESAVSECLRQWYTDNDIDGYVHLDAKRRFLELVGEVEELEQNN